jgi:hypothetical protein
MTASPSPASSFLALSFLAQFDIVQRNTFS